MKTFVLLIFTASTLAACGKNDPTTTTTGAVTFWQDVAPIYNDKCVKCHQAGGIGPFALDNYLDAMSEANEEARLTGLGTMPPYHIVHDGTCGAFHDEGTLTVAQKATIKAWADAGAPEGTMVTLTRPATPKLEGALDLKTPSFMPVAQGGTIAQDDEYRCFLMNAPNTTDAFLTAYDVTPGEATIVHHVLTFVVDPQALGDNGKTNAEIMQTLDDASPDRLGWPCFGAAGDNVAVEAVPVTWAPGQGVVSYPAGMGVPVKSTNKLVVQVHYNLADPLSRGKTDSTTVHLRFADKVDRALSFLLPDPFLDSLHKSPPDVLAPGMKDATYKWTLSGKDLGIADGSVDLVAVMPHMHGRGVRQVLKLGPTGALACASDLESWDFHWQEFYFYKTFPKITPTTNVEVTCEYDTSMDTAPVLPGWGTRNEMCLTVLMVALPTSSSGP